MDSSIHFADQLRPTRSNVSQHNHAGGVYPIRVHSRSRVHKTSFDHKINEVDDPDGEDEDAGLRNEGDYKSRQNFNLRQIFFLAYQSVGVIYGDIGTSPLYVFSSTFSSAPVHIDLLGALSLIIWSITLMVTVKYVLIVLRADNEGEGGTFSTYSLLSRYANISNRDPREATMIRMERHLTDDLSRSNRNVRSAIEKSKFFRGLLKTIGVLAVSMVISDGILTPAQSVLGAVQGLNVAVPDISKSTVVGVTCAILILLFVVQPIGVTKISVVFAPIVIVWLAFNAGFGIYNLANYDYRILKAFNPYYAFAYLVRNKEQGWRSLGGILLSFTGVEALFADIGAFSRQAVQLSWLGYTYPCLLLAYSGQAAYISRFPEAYSNPFYNAAPKGWVIPSLVIAILAAVVASQAIITATFQLMAQIMKLSYFPQIKVVHTSTIYHGQLYVPAINWLMMVGTVLVAGIYNNTTSLGNAYGVCVMFVTFFDTCMVTLVAIVVWRMKAYLVFFPWLIIACFDGTFLSSSLVKVPDGAWFTLALSCVLAAVFILWRFGKEQQWFAEASDRFPTTHFVATRSDGKLQLSERFGEKTLSSIEGFGIFFDKAGETTPIVFSNFIRKLVTAPEVIVFFHLRPLETPSVAPENRYSVSRLAIPNCYRLVVRHGYMDEVITPDLASLVFEKVRHHIVVRALDTEKADAVTSGADARDTGTLEHLNNTSKISGKTLEPDHVSSLEPSSLSEVVPTNSATPSSSSNFPSHLNTTSSRLAALERAYNHEILYIVGKEQMTVKQGTNLVRKWLLEAFLFLRENTRTKVASLGLDRERVIEVGFVKEV
ncbi:potassium transporter [Delitschia confertaspora ATCC 74209]|uniref:Potassium transporter n=1 Tax=Delitschia confertaspora ATCC 74209 TaxID=1513339 RepID=A0A9P4JP54_9PLEO|nr:potassium transporter [Delitschia confertaspora ATCC 74209]